METRKILLSLLGIAFIGLAVFGLVYTKGFGYFEQKKKAQWQAVFLSNGQVYFGYVRGEGKQYVSLTNIYYLQVDQQQTLQPGREREDKQEQPKLSLAKLGGELHGPKDEMRINRDHILFIEDLKEDSKVVSAIKEYLKNQEKK